ncbi:hypothetical protein ZZ1p0002 [Acinetobacter phage ZZ1]|jgi:hypothetical protein|uniref:Uncharacterized protein n=2 Tax=Caudoviricetes TaxID=2731619 RepID=G0YKC1_9CAUD|nr:hypothetical protein ZZ1p0002 [Acinetobacter phage ZZ1]AEJ90200.2 hypothetical protein ZZ1p0002 [Acinetobacter phage ZZ1]
MKTYTDYEIALDQELNTFLDPNQMQDLKIVQIKQLMILYMLYLDSIQ